MTKQCIKLLDFGLAKQNAPLRETDPTVTEKSKIGRDASLHVAGSRSHDHPSTVRSPANRQQPILPGRRCAALKRSCGYPRARVDFFVLSSIVGKDATPTSSLMRLPTPLKV